jgi:preprotein translocase subunit SecG
MKKITITLNALVCFSSLVLGVMTNAQAQAQSNRVHHQQLYKKQK